VRQCRSAGLVSAETLHIDASLIRADVSMDALIERHLGTVDEMNDAERMARSSGKYKKLCRSDPEASMATSSRQPLRPSYKQHTAVDDHSGIVVDVEIVTGEEHDTNRLEQRLDAIEQALGRAAGRITADASYGIVCGCPLFGKHDLRFFGGVFDRTCVRPLSVAFDDATGRYAVRKAGFTSVQRAASARAPGLNVPALNFEVRVAYSSSIAHPGLAAMPCLRPFSGTGVTPSCNPPASS
jgi:hypothetical protein